VDHLLLQRLLPQMTQYQLVLLLIVFLKFPKKQNLLNLLALQPITSLQ
jgi:hypothetical protein